MLHVDDEHGGPFAGRNAQPHPLLLIERLRAMVVSLCAELTFGISSKLLRVVRAE